MLLAESLLGTSSTAANYIEDVFSTYLYTGNSTSLGTQTITNNIDLSTKGGMVWIKGRSAAANHYVADTVRGAGISGQSNNGLFTNTQDAENGVSGTDYDFISSFGSTGFTVQQYGGTTAERCTNYNGVTYSSWAFRKQAKFFDIVTYTGTGSARTISHSLGSVPGAIFIKARNEIGDWTVYHRSVGNASYLALNSTASSAATTAFNSTTPTSTVFSIGANNTVNRSGTTYVAYLFAHDAGGFGVTGADNVISCGSWSGTGSPVTVNLGWEPQWILWKRSSGAGSWFLGDSMRSMTASDNGQGQVKYLSPNTSNEELGSGAGAFLLGTTSTGFVTDGETGTHIYIAIRRGPMRTPTSGTSVFSPIASGATQGTPLTTNFPVDMQITAAQNVSLSRQVVDRLRGVSTNSTASGRYLQTNATSAEIDDPGSALFWNNTGFQVPLNYSGANNIFWNFRRAPGFFDVVCYTGNAASNTQSHNLGVAPELVITKSRNTAQNWLALHTFTASSHQYQFLNTTDAQAAITYASNGFLSSRPTATQLPVTGPYPQINGSGTTYVAYLFASCPGVSKVGTYTGTGATQTIDCGFAAGARFVLIKRTNSTGDWYVWDSARGIVAANDPYLVLNSTATEVTNTDWVDTAASGFELSNAGGNLVNTNGANYIFLAIA